MTTRPSSKSGLPIGLLVAVGVVALFSIALCAGAYLYLPAITELSQFANYGEEIPPPTLLFNEEAAAGSVAEAAQRFDSLAWHFESEQESPVRSVQYSYERHDGFRLVGDAIGKGQAIDRIEIRVAGPIDGNPIAASKVAADALEVLVPDSWTAWRVSLSRMADVEDGGPARRMGQASTDSGWRITTTEYYRPKDAQGAVDTLLIVAEAP